MHQTPSPVSKSLIEEEMAACRITRLERASIREIKRLADNLEKKSGVRFFHMEMGIPGLPPCPIGVEAQVAALQRGVAAIYPDIQGIPEIKPEIARFVKLFLNVSVDPEHCLPTSGSTMGSMACFLTINRMWAEREGTLFLDPGFPVHKQQCRLLGHTYRSFDMYQHRGEKLRDMLLEHLETGKVSSILYSNPNNPTWICLNERELEIIGRLASDHEVIVIEDLAYVGMDFRRDTSIPGQPPFVPTVARYTDNFILLISGSKAFSYAGERIGMLVVSDSLWERRAPDLKRYFTSDTLGHALLYGTLYALSAGTSHSAQLALAAILKAVNEGRYTYLDVVREYGQKAHEMKRIFTENGFRIVYDRDLDEPLADGFYFTISYPGLTGDALLRGLLSYGVSAISLVITDSQCTEGLRACSSLIQKNELPDLRSRIQAFHKAHPLDAAGMHCRPQED